jgi:2-keto-4-pentenoate hydratase/2-oxohepta-3-ene-1,7-dioic acid hydratase in catechol pathway
MNYYSHKEECISAGVDKKERTASVYFSKRATTIITSGDIIDRHSDITNECDYEGELGVILYKDIYKPTKEEIYDSIFGYVIINDVSARDLQRLHQQYYFAKSLDTYTVMSEVLVTKDTFNDYPSLNIKTYINDELRQNDSTDNMIYSIEDMLLELSRGMTLKSGTILSTGTPSGVGMGMNPKAFLKENDKIRIEIENIGILENICK